MSNIKQLEISKEQALEAVELRDALIALQKNKHYKRIFEKELFQDFAAQCVLAKGSNASQNETAQKAIDRDIAMIGSLNARLYSIIALGDNAEAALADIDAELEAAMAEEE